MKLAGFNRTRIAGAAQIGILILTITSGCGTQVGNPFDEKKETEEEKSNSNHPDNGTPMNGNKQNDPLRPPASGEPASMQGLAKCTATATLTALDTGVTTGKVTFVFTPDASAQATITYTTPSGASETGLAIDPTTKGLYVVKVDFTGSSVCYLTLTIDDTNLSKNVEVAVTSP
jgi:hypothetical protein